MCNNFKDNRSTQKVRILPLSILKEHEEIDNQHFKKLYHEMIEDGILKKPILVDEKILIILDGHHRYAVLKALKASFIPTFMVDYSSHYILVKSWRKGYEVNKEIVTKAGLSGKKLPYKTSRYQNT